METNTLRRGWTTGACATAAAKAAYAALQTGTFPDPVHITLPGGNSAAFALAETARGTDFASAAVVKDAGDDPDVTHGALIRVTIRLLPPGSGTVFVAGPGVGTVTRPGLPIPPGEPAINPIPRQMIRAALADADAEVTIGVDDGERLAERTLNGRLGIVGGLSILGTTGIVVPYSCAAWIDTIHRGIDVAVAMGIGHVAGSTGSTSEAAVQKLHAMPDVALLEMGDFAGGMLKYLRAHPVARVTVAGGVAKMTKLAQGRLDLHSKRGEADLTALAALTADPALQAKVAASNTVAEAFAHAPSLGDMVAAAAWETAAAVLYPATIDLEVVLFDRTGTLAGRHPFRPVHAAPRNRR